MLSGKMYGKLRIEIDDADIVARALKPDDLDWCRCHSENGTLVIEVETDKIGALLSAIDDYLLNLKAIFPILKFMNSRT